MSGIEYLADTNCFIYFLDGHPAFSSFIYDNWAFSYISEIELLSKSTLTSEQENTIKFLLSSCIRFDHTQAISDKAIYIRKTYKLKLPDAIIAATAQLYDIPFLTTDKEFSKIKDFNCLILDL